MSKINKLDIEKLMENCTIPLYNLDWKIKLVEEIDFLRAGGSPSGWAYLSSEDETIYMCKGKDHLHLDTFFKAVLQLSLWAYAGTKDYEDKVIDEELTCNLMGMGLYKLFNNNICDLRDKDDISKLQFRLYNYNVKVKITDNVEIKSLDDDARAIWDLSSETIYLNGDYPDKLLVPDFLHEFCHVCFRMNYGSSLHDKGYIDSEIAINLVAQGMCDLYRQGVLQFNNNKR